MLQNIDVDRMYPKSLLEANSGINRDYPLEIGDHEVILQREKGSARILAAYRKKGSENWLPVLAPVKSEGASLIAGQPDIQSLSDFIFFLSGNEPPRVRTSKVADVAMLQRLSFRDLLWYCNLRQDYMDSSFFYLDPSEDKDRRRKSQDVIRVVLGFHTENIAELQANLNKVTEERLELLNSATTLQKVVAQTNIKNSENIVGELSRIREELSRLDQTIYAARMEMQTQIPHPIDLLRTEAKNLSLVIGELVKSIRNYDYKIEEQNKLFYEFLTAGVKAKRASVAGDILRDITFSTCPQCGTSIEDRNIASDHCSLCSQPYSSEEPLDLESVTNEFELKRKEITTSIDTLRKEKMDLEDRSADLRKQKDHLDDQIESALKSYNSRYLESILIQERERSRLQGMMEELERLLGLLNKVDEYKKKHDALASDEERLRRELRQAREAAESNRSTIKELEELFLESLRKANFPDMDENHYVEISTIDFLPKIKHSLNPTYETQYAFLGSGGKKTLFKGCFAIALHRLAARHKVELFPSLLIIDGPMKNLSSNENKEIYEGFYEYLYELATGDLAGVQIILVDSEFYPPSDAMPRKPDLRKQHMTLHDPEHPRLIPYYRE